MATGDEKKECRRCPEGQVLRDGECRMPEVTFSAFIMSLNTSALFHLGEIPDPESGEKRQDLVLARHAIDTLAMLQKKTAGNLDDEERELLSNIVYDLQMRYIRVSG
jgi:hypothetical protein